MSFSCEGDGREYLERRKNFLLLLFISALLLLSGCDYLSGFKEVEISQTGISKVCDKKHKLKYPEIVPAYTSWIYFIEGYNLDDIKELASDSKRNVYLLSRNKCYPDLVKCLTKRNYEIEPIVILAEYYKTNPTGFISFPSNEIFIPFFTPQAGISGFYGKLIGTYDIHVGIYNRSGIDLHLKSAQLWIVRGYKTVKNESCKK